MSRSGGLKPRAVAGKPSVTRLTHNSWTGINASGMPSAAVRKILRKKEEKETVRGSNNPQNRCLYESDFQYTTFFGLISCINLYQLSVFPY